MILKDYEKMIEEITPEDLRYARVCLGTLYDTLFNYDTARRDIADEWIGVGCALDLAKPLKLLADVKKDFAYYIKETAEALHLPNPEYVSFPDEDEIGEETDDE